MLEIDDHEIEARVRADLGHLGRGNPLEAAENEFAVPEPLSQRAPVRHGSRLSQSGPRATGEGVTI
jgi:hypothetical protein